MLCSQGNLKLKYDFYQAQTSWSPKRYITFFLNPVEGLFRQNSVLTLLYMQIWGFGNFLVRRTWKVLQGGTQQSKPRPSKNPELLHTCASQCSYLWCEGKIHNRSHKLRLHCKSFQLQFLISHGTQITASIYLLSVMRYTFWELRKDMHQGLWEPAWSLSHLQIFKEDLMFFPPCIAVTQMSQLELWKISGWDLESGKHDSKARAIAHISFVNQE